MFVLRRAIVDVINFTAGGSEAFLVYLGRGTPEAYKARRQEDGEMCLVISCLFVWHAPTNTLPRGPVRIVVTRRKLLSAPRMVARPLLNFHGLPVSIFPRSHEAERVHCFVCAQDCSTMLTSGMPCSVTQATRLEAVQMRLPFVRCRGTLVVAARLPETPWFVRFAE